MGSVGSNAGLHTHAWSDKFAHAHVHGYCQLVGCSCIYHHAIVWFVVSFKVLLGGMIVFK